jgi:hypothetical protein
LASGVFLIQADGLLVEMSEENYGQETDFQELLAKYPNLLAGNQIDEVNPSCLLASRDNSCYLRNNMQEQRLGS